MIDPTKPHDMKTITIAAKEAIEDMRMIDSTKPLDIELITFAVRKSIEDM